jgi:hypothetical protein
MAHIIILAIFVLAFVAVVVTVIVVIARRSAAPGTAIARATRIIAVITAAVTALATVTDVIRDLTAASVRISLPVQQFWPTLPATADVQGLTATVTGGGFTVADVDVDGLDAAARTWLSVSTLLQGATTVAVALVVIVLCSNLIKQDPFRSTLTRSVNITAVIIMVGGIAWQVAGIVAGTLAADQVLRWQGWGMDSATVDWTDITEIIGLPSVGNNWSVDFWPIGVGLALLALSAAFRYGERLQKDTEGLV